MIWENEVFFNVVVLVVSVISLMCTHCNQNTLFILHMAIKNLTDTVLVSIYSLQILSINSFRDGHF